METQIQDKSVTSAEMPIEQLVRNTEIKYGLNVLYSLLNKQISIVGNELDLALKQNEVLKARPQTLHLKAYLSTIINGIEPKLMNAEGDDLKFIIISLNWKYLEIDNLLKSEAFQIEAGYKAETYAITIGSALAINLFFDLIQRLEIRKHELSLPSEISLNF